MDGAAAEVPKLGAFEHYLRAAFPDSRLETICEPICLSVLVLFGYARVGQRPGIPVARTSRS